MTETPGSHLGRPRRGGEGGRRYVVLRTRGIRLGTPYVIAEWIDASIGGLPRSAEAFTEDEMHCDPRLGTALEAWRAGDDVVRTQEAAAVSRLVEAAAAVDARVATSVATTLDGPLDAHPDEPEEGDDGMGSSPGCGSSRSVITLGDRATMRCIECRAEWDWGGTEAVAAVPGGHGRGVPR